MSGSDPTNVVTSQHIASLRGAINFPDKFVSKIETFAGQEIPFFVESRDTLKKTKEGLLSRLAKLEEGVGRTPRNDSAFTSLVEAITAYGHKAEADSKRDHKISFFLGRESASSVNAFENKIKSHLPTTAKSAASGAINDVLGKTNVKDAGKVGPNVKHASAGNKNKKDALCTLFFTREEADQGMETIITVVGIGSHSGPSSYMIHWSSTSKLVEGHEFSL